MTCDLFTHVEALIRDPGIRSKPSYVMSYLALLASEAERAPYQVDQTRAKELIVELKAAAEPPRAHPGLTVWDGF